jgi:hypothetical protein
MQYLVSSRSVCCHTWHRLRADRQCTYNVKLRCVRVTVVVVDKQNITYSECVSVASVILHAMRMRRIISSSAACSAVP